ncbi:Nicotinamide/nicotinic acid mononucleotide adenylyltransferase 1 [Microbotryomycetes sp. JL201]|nr:Nicotinamide/nicotinic acid mononucleotide adenylyltransferase 1 [Microbotryomycetes sp. JL201]
MDEAYTLPTYRLQALTGSFSPITFLHLRMFEMARDDARLNTDYSVVGGYLSPVNDRYLKPGLASATHRLNMCNLAVQDMSEWIMVDPWEAKQPDYTPTAQVLDHFDHELNTVRGGADVLVTDPDTGETRIEKRRIQIKLLAGSDLIMTMSEPGVWAEKDLHHILGRYGCYIIERAESELDKSIFSSSAVHSRSPLALYRDNIHMVNQLVQNDVSSTKVRLFLRRGLSVLYLVPTVVAKYIERNGLYQNPDRKAADNSPRSSPAPHDAETEREGRRARERDTRTMSVDDPSTSGSR